MVKSNIFLSAAMAWSLTNNGVTAFTPSQPNLSSYSCPSTTTTSTNTALTAIKNSRREIFLRTGSTIASALLTTTNIMSPANAASSPPTADELNRIRTGYANIQYLLDNWEKETTVCREQGGAESGCKRDAEAVRRYLGLRSTTDPLFQIEKVFAKVRFMDDIDPDKLEDFFQAAEDWDSTIAMSNSMAFISQFGEYNPGGGKDEVLKYLNESEKQVILAEKNLKIILDTINSAGSS